VEELPTGSNNSVELRVRKYLLTPPNIISRPLSSVTKLRGSVLFGDISYQWKALGVVISARGIQELVEGTYISTEAVAVSPSLIPPATSTFPFESSVAI
jgi:hypothetical protein